MGIQVILHHHDSLCLGAEFIRQRAQCMGVVQLGAPLRNRDVPPADQELEEDKQVARALALILVVEPLGLIRSGRARMCASR